MSAAAERRRRRYSRYPAYIGVAWTSSALSNFLQNSWVAGKVLQIWSNITIHQVSKKFACGGQAAIHVQYPFFKFNISKWLNE